jgi:copper oxidase (laccase) domain-containing protein
LRPDRIFTAGLCTRSHPDVFHSYRAKGSGAGRMLGIIRAR